MTDLETIIDGLYEAAFIPDNWPGVLDQICAVSGSASGELQIIDGISAPRFRATGLTHDVLDQFICQGLWRSCERSTALLSNGHCGFLCEADFLSPEETARDPVAKVLAPLGLGWLTGTIIPMPSGELASFTFERLLTDGRIGESQIAVLDSLRPHLARAGLIAARLRLEQARSAVAALEAIGLAAAVLNAVGHVLAANPLLEQMPSTFLPLAFGRLGVSNAPAQALFKKALAQIAHMPVAAARSIPIPARDGEQPLVLHLLPLVRDARAVFSGAEILLVATALKPSAMVPSPKLLHALFDLSPSEAKLAAALAAGQSLKQAGAAMGVTFSTARTYIESVFRKTGTHQQSQLVALLKSMPPINGRG